MVQERRLRRLETAILHALAPVVSHGLVDPRLRMVTVTRIRLAPDLAVARVNWSLIGTSADRAKAARALEHARGHLQGVLAKQVSLRSLPRLEFHYDESLEKADRVQRILADLARDRGDAEPPPDDAAPAAEPDDDED
jgi:ribosome-binding factor A